ncbi:MAG: ABC transporter permease [Sphaerochaetaceae bacterium]|nr:ABC transporter permease [Sphaerochaetaceae bacterium]
MNRASLTWRYTFSTRNRHRRMSLLIMASLAVGLAALIVIMSVMNSLQDEVLDQLRNVQSFHIEIEGVGRRDSAAVVSALKQIDGVQHVYPFKRVRSVIASESRSASVLVIGYAPEFFREDNPFTRRVFLDSIASSPSSEGVYLSLSLMNSLNLSYGETLSFTLLSRGVTLARTVQEKSASVTGLFSTQLKDVSTGSVLVPLSFLNDREEDDELSFGLYVQDLSVREGNRIAGHIAELLPGSVIHKWQEIHGPFYSALLLEKSLMYVFLFFMFVIITFHQKNSTLRLYHSKQRELAILRSIGMSRENVRWMMIQTAMVVSSSGIAIGAALGVLVVRHLPGMFALANRIHIRVFGTSNPLLSYPITPILNIGELLISGSLILFLSFLFSAKVVSKALKKEPMELLHHA